MARAGRMYDYKANRVRLKPNDLQESILLEMARRCSALWNVANYECRQAFLAQGRYVPGYAELCKFAPQHSLL